MRDDLCGVTPCRCQCHEEQTRHTTNKKLPTLNNSHPEFRLHPQSWTALRPTQGFYLASQGERKREREKRREGEKERKREGQVSPGSALSQNKEWTATSLPRSSFSPHTVDHDERSNVVKYLSNPCAKDLHPHLRLRPQQIVDVQLLLCAFFLSLPATRSRFACCWCVEEDTTVILRAT